MALLKGTNCYVDLAEAEAYFADRLDVAAWTDIQDNAIKEQALVTATMMLDDMVWTGIAADTSQPLAFPRIGVFFDPRLGVDVSMSGIPKRLATGCMELAYHLLNNDGLLDNAGGVRDLEIGPIKLKGVQTPDKVPMVVKRHINPLLENAGSRSWWRAN